VQQGVPLVSWKLNYTSAIDQQCHEFTTSTKVDFAEAAYTAAPDLYVDAQRNRFNIAKAMEEAKKAAEESRYSDARCFMARACAATKETHSAMVPDVAKMMDECMAVQEELTETSYARGGSQALSTCVGRHMMQRANDASDTAQYQNAWKCQMKRAKK